MNINFTLKLKLIILVFLIAIGSSCLAGENIKSKRRVIEFNQNAFISEINKDKLKYKHLYEYSDGELYALFVKYVAYNELLNEEDVDQIFNTKEVLNDLQTILEIVGKDKKKLKFTVCSEEEQDRIIDKISLPLNEYVQVVSSGKYQLMAEAFEAFNKFDIVVKTWWREWYIKGQISGGAGIAINGVILSPYSIFDLMDIPWILNRDSSGLLTIDKELFRDTMEEVKIGTYIDFTVVNVGEVLSTVPPMLIVKNGDDNFAFFSLGGRIIFNLTLSELFLLVNNTMKFIIEELYGSTSHIIVLFNDNKKAVEGIARKFAISSITSYFLELQFYLS